MIADRKSTEDAAARIERVWRTLASFLPHRAAIAALPPVEIIDLPISRFGVRSYRWQHPDSDKTLVLIHGGAANGRIMATFAPLALAHGMSAVAVDLPGYGATRVPEKRAVRYGHWCDVAAAVVERCAAAGEVYVLGISMGGLLAYDAVALARSSRIKGLLGTCFLLPGDPATRRHLFRWSWMARIAPPLMERFSRVADPLSVPMPLAARISAVSNHDIIARIISSDAYSGGTWMPGGFLRTYLAHQPIVAPEDFDVCPVILAHPEEDRWTPIALSLPFFERLRSPKQLITLPRAGHFPIEQPGYRELATALASLGDGETDSRPDERTATAR